MKWTKKALILSGAIFLGLGIHAQAQSTDQGSTGTDSSRRIGMRHFHQPRNGQDSLRREGWRSGTAEAGKLRGGREGHAWADGRRGEHGFAGRSVRPGRERAGRHTIHFTPGQRQQMMAINKDYHKRAADLFLKDNSTLKEYKDGLIALQKEKKSKLQALLTPQQKEEMEKWKAKRSENAQVMAAGRLERLKIRLSLTDDQVAKVKAGQASLKAKAQSIHENDNLLPQQKMEQLKDLMAKREDALKSVLTPEQLSKFQEMHKMRGHRNQSWGNHPS